MVETKAVRSLDLAQEAQSKLLIIGIVGAVGSGTSWTSEILKSHLEKRHMSASIVKARSGISKLVGTEWEKALELRTSDPIKMAESLQELGDRLREQHDHAIVASAMIAEIDELLEKNSSTKVVICDSLRHPAEAKLLRMVYGDAYWMLGTVCNFETRRERLVQKFSLPDGTPPEVLKLQKFIDRDEDDSLKKNGQHVAATFELADYFVDTSAKLSSLKAPDTEIAAWPGSKELGRFLDLVLADRVMLRPTDAEQAMYHAYAARLGSACLSRQVGAALIDKKGQLLATGCNEVPRAGGGLYGQGTEGEVEQESGRCYKINGFCSNTRERNVIVKDIMDLFERHGIKPEELNKNDLIIKDLRRSRLGQLIEFSRSVHAEMDALISAARKGVSTLGGKLFVTTFPCHNCARHIVAAGIDEVQFIEPYLKSKALSLHNDSITQDLDGWVAPSSISDGNTIDRKRVLFRPYIGAAPRLYRRAFVKDGEVKDGITGKFLEPSEISFLRLRPLPEGYSEIQKKITENFNQAVKNKENLQT